MAMVAIFKKIRKIMIYRNGLTDFDEIWHDDASRPTPCKPMKFDVHPCLGLVRQFNLSCTNKLGQKNTETPHQIFRT